MSAMGMQVIKRDGSTVSFDRHKIVVAIQKANKAVEEGERLPESDIDTIASFVEGKKRKRFLVEDIQDMVEKQIMNSCHQRLRYCSGSPGHRTRGPDFPFPAPDGR